MRQRSIEGRVRLVVMTLAVLLGVIACGSSGGSTPTPTPLGGGAGSSGSAAPSASAASTRPTDGPSSDPSATSTDDGPATISGQVTWQATTTSRVSPDLSEVWTVSGTMDLILDEDLGQFVAVRGRSTYAYDLEHLGCSPPTHEEGTLETAIQSYEEDGVAQALIFGPVGEDFEMQIFFDDSWVVTCPPGPALPEGTIANAFPGCAQPQGRVAVAFDGAGSYRIACDIQTDYDNGGIVITGRIEGTLSPVPAP